LLAIIFGSYASGNYTKNSDIDILLVFQKIENSKKIENTAKKVSMKTNTQLNPVYLSYQEFKESLHNSTKEFFKKLKKDKIIFIGVEWWRQLINEEA
jgi:predicted nucleotidyltransferase